MPTRAEPSASAQGRYTLSSRQGNRARQGQAALIEEADEAAGDDGSPFRLPFTPTGQREHEMIRHTGLQPSVGPDHDASVVLQQQGNLNSLEKGFAALKAFDWKACRLYILQHPTFLPAASQKHFLDEAGDQLRETPNPPDLYYRQCIQAATLLQQHQRLRSDTQVLCRYLSDLERETATKNRPGPNLEIFLGSFKHLFDYVVRRVNQERAISRHAGGTASNITKGGSANNLQSKAVTNQPQEHLSLLSQPSHTAPYEDPTGLATLAISETIDPQRITSMPESIKGKERADQTRNMDQTQPQGTPHGQRISSTRTGGSAASGLSILTARPRDIRGTTNDREKLDPRYRKRPDAADFFCRGRVFALLWHENAESPRADKDIENREDELGDLFARSEGRQGQTLFTRGPFGEYIYSHIRRMVVVKELYGYSWCIPINTYGGKGAAKRGMSVREIQAHAVIYSNDGRDPPKKEIGMIKEAIAVDLLQGENLHPKSRVNYSKPNTVEHNVKVLEIGMISKDCMGKFEGQWQTETDPALKSYKSEHPNTLRRRSTVSQDQRHGPSSSAGERRPSVAERSTSRHHNVQSSTGSSTRPQAEPPRTGDRGSRQQPQFGPRPQDWRGPGRGRHSS